MATSKPITRTFKELVEIDELVGAMYQRDPKLPLGKFGYAYKRFVDKNYLPALNDLQQEIGGVRIDHALEDQATKEVLLDRTNSRGYKYNKVGLKAVIAAEKKLRDEWDEKVITIIPYISSAVPADILSEEKEALKGLVL